MNRAFWITYGGSMKYAGSQKDRKTWRWEKAPRWMQDQVAYRGYLDRGWQPWACHP